MKCFPVSLQRRWEIVGGLMKLGHETLNVCLLLSPESGFTNLKRQTQKSFQ